MITITPKKGLSFSQLPLILICSLLLFACSNRDGDDGTIGEAGVAGETGTNGLVSLVNISIEPAGSDCADAGQRVDSGIDANADGILDPIEVDASTTICPQPGVNGTNGLSSAIAVTEEPAGGNCYQGGQRIDSGIDDNNSGNLDTEEIDQTVYLCPYDTPNALYTISGTVTGLNGELTNIANSLRNDSALTLFADGPFTFAIPLPQGALYKIVVVDYGDAEQEIFCQVSNGIGTVAENDINNIVIECVPVTKVWYADKDADNYGDPEDLLIQDSRPSGFVRVASDCNDTDDSIRPGAIEVANLADDNCNGEIDEAFKYMFVSSTSYNGNLGGLDGADKICQALANAGTHVPYGYYKAWLSSSSVSAGDRLSHATVPYVSTQSATIADDWQDLVNSGEHYAPVAYDENGVYRVFRTYTNTLYSGEKKHAEAISNCNNWTDESSSYFTLFGYSTYVDQRWTDASAGSSCNGLSPAALYCIQQ